MRSWTCPHQTQARARTTLGTMSYSIASAARTRTESPPSMRHGLPVHARLRPRVWSDLTLAQFTECLRVHVTRFHKELLGDNGFSPDDGLPGGAKKAKPGREKKRAVRSLSPSRERARLGSTLPSLSKAEQMRLLRSDSFAFGYIVCSSWLMFGHCSPLHNLTVSLVEPDAVTRS